jgi:hypothetical protein
MAEIMGFLLKRRGGKFGVHMKNAWQSRHFEIKDGVIYYYEDGGKKGKPRGKLSLSDASLVKYTTYEHAPPFSFSFEVVPPGKEEKWRLCANNKTEMDMWCDSLEKYVKDTTDLSTTQSSETVAGGSANEMTGFLLKRRGGKFGSKMKNAWQGRYFEIKDGSISYFEEGGETVKARGKLSLNGAETSLLKNTTYEQAAPSAFTFELVPLPVPGSTVEEKWRLCASSLEEMQEWCLCIQACIGNEGTDAAKLSAGSDSGPGDMQSKQSSLTTLGDPDESSHSTRDDDDNDIFQTDVYGGDDVVMSLAWQRRSARTKSGVDRVACEAATRAALELERERELEGQGGGQGQGSTSALEFDDLELDEEEQEQEGEGEGGDLESSAGKTRSVRVSIGDVTIGGEDSGGVYVHSGEASSHGTGGSEEATGQSPSISLGKQ